MKIFQARQHHKGATFALWNTLSEAESLIQDKMRHVRQIMETMIVYK